ncbi:hypothetical protein ABZ816_23740 [Actinosynnema sp. NPDC047251]|uniref:Uncharacterized protein n=1 Tax=Saccharothrix espanaensis (strain ATCC 51144 / DSM 44229 / JCM 9112 / NBRC 15066 / NRRL 15764) TaxID=1179773 RepID=K0JXB1_SACES|nr:hypothetical protein [Saccharothrix espanaensis]CCH32515.1 hypothetical protein BN6_52510 [Saccharothrix espanaensis DSM 44229]
MSESAWLLSDRHRVKLGLGKPVRSPDGSVDHFHDGSQNSRNSDLTRALWKFLADYGDGPVRVVTSYQPEFTAVAEYRTIGGDALDDTDFPEYLRDWTG